MEQASPRATIEPVLKSPMATTTEAPTPQSPVPQEKPPQGEAHTRQVGGSPHAPQREETCGAMKTQCSQKIHKIKIIKWKRTVPYSRKIIIFYNVMMFLLYHITGLGNMTDI